MQGGTVESARAWLTLLLVAGALALGSTTCGTDKPAKPPPNTAIRLNFDEWHTDSLRCERKQCRDWFAFDLPQRRLVQIDVYYPAGPGLPDFGMTLQDAGFNTLLTSKPSGRSPRRMTLNLDPGRYYVLLESATAEDELLSYEIVASMKRPRRQSGREAPPPPSPPPPPPPPPAEEFRIVKAEVLEVERCEGQPCAVLIDAGTSARIARGMRGELKEAGQKLADIKVEEVFEAGSRARIVGDLDAPITLDTMAHIRVPDAQRPQ